MIDQHWARVFVEFPVPTAMKWLAPGRTKSTGAFIMIRIGSAGKRRELLPLIPQVRNLLAVQAILSLVLS